jgi:hypothetical protein
MTMLHALDSHSTRARSSPVTEAEKHLLSYERKLLTWKFKVDRSSDEFCEIHNGLVKAIGDYMVDPQLN